MKKIAIIGAGCSGLAAIKCCLDEGLMPECFEMSQDVGGLWNYTHKPEEGRGSAYKSLVINTSKEMMAFSDFPPPENFPAFMPHEYVLKYFKMYAGNFGLYQYINFGTRVEKLNPAFDYATTGRWDVTVKRQSQDKSETKTYDGVLVCSGHHTHPYMPKIQGLEKYSGRILHSHSYKTNDEFAGKKILVVGKYYVI
ncbi:hypothetical protein FSP39_008654 [Pinctada imbricata]|uniref:Flavin-containing monooxygenase n=1 Tax=Pinctada imbricata TaxID=66713 RepID=A0AA89BK81_PINIB|nr:hypothetical protein FSP39_008654 [Pinctada imbricata]